MSEDRIEALKQLLEQEPHDTMLLFGLGNEFFSSGHYTEAIPYFEEAVRVDPEPYYRDRRHSRAFIGHCTSGARRACQEP